MTARSLAAACLLLAAPVLSAQQYKFLTSVAVFKALPGKDHAIVEKGKAFIPVLDKLLSAGTIQAYGIDVDMLHVPGESNIAFWVVSPDFAAVEKSESAIDEFLSSNPSVIQEIVAMTDPAAHHDLIVRAREANHRAVPAGAMPVNDFDIVRIKPGKMEDFMALFRKYDKPILEKLVADGIIYSYELDTEAVHTREPGLTWTILVMPNLAAKDKVTAAYAEAEKALPESERNMVEKLYQETIVPGSHRDSLSRSVVYKEK